LATASSWSMVREGPRRRSARCSHPPDRRGARMARPMVPLLVSIPADIDPIERGERFEAPLNRARWHNGRPGRVVGGGRREDAGRHPMLRVLDWFGPTVPPLATVRELLDRRERRYALGRHFYMVGWQPLPMQFTPRQLGRADERRLERPGLVVPYRERYLRGR